MGRAATDCKNVGGGKPRVGGIDRSALGAPSKLGGAAEDEENA